jgi:hypothetical protein
MQVQRKVFWGVAWEAHPTRRELNSDLGFGGLSSRKLISHTVKAQRGCSLLLSDVCLRDKIWLVISWTSCSWGPEMSWTDTVNYNIWIIWINDMFRMIWPGARCSDRLKSLKGWRGVWRWWWPTAGCGGPVVCWSLSLISGCDTENQWKSDMEMGQNYLI